MKAIIAIDDSVYSRDMLHLLGRRHWPQDCQMKIVTVVEPIQGFRDDLEDGLQIEISGRRRKHFEQLASQARDYLAKHVPDAIIHYEVREGNPSFEIIMAATEWEAQKIFIGAHGHSVCPHNLLGSVSRSVAERAGCTVEVVRTGVAGASKTHAMASKAVTQ